MNEGAWWVWRCLFVAVRIKKKKKKFNSVEKQHMVCAEWADSCFMHS